MEKILLNQNALQMIGPSFEEVSREELEIVGGDVQANSIIESIVVTYVTTWVASCLSLITKSK